MREELLREMSRSMRELTGGKTEEYRKLVAYFEEHGREITEQAFRMYTRGDTLPLCDNLAMIGRYYGVSTDWLLGLSPHRTTGDAVAELRDAMMRAAEILIDA